MSRVWSQLRAALREEGGGVLVSVLATAGSAPREPGARMVVRPGGGFHGTIGGGELEWRCLAESRNLLEQAETAVAQRDFALGPNLGQCCGGRVQVLFERFDRKNRDTVDRLAGLEELGPFATEAVLLEGPAPLGRAASGPANLGMPRVRLTANRLEEVFGLLHQPVTLFGAGHVARALVLALAPLPFAVSWIDSRADAFPAAVPGNVTCRVLPQPQVAIAQAPVGAFVLVMTHDHALDLQLTHAALDENRFGYVGLIGSSTKRARFERRMRQAGLPAKYLEKLTCPIGVAGIRSREPAAIAAATAVQLLQCNEQLATPDRAAAPAVGTWGE